MSVRLGVLGCLFVCLLKTKSISGVCLCRMKKKRRMNSRKRIKKMKR